MVKQQLMIASLTALMMWTYASVFYKYGWGDVKQEKYGMGCRIEVCRTQFPRVLVL